MRDLESLFQALQRSTFRTGFRLNAKDLHYLQQKGLPIILDHAERFIAERLAPAVVANDGQQTPMRGHPVFVAQHATATCCRGCLSKWHRMAEGRALTLEEQAYIVVVIEHWLMAYLPAPDAGR
ncbi:DUF4186 domain-containing protein [Methylophilus sp.]|jgi:hypothetical protein|uniref:DUF4186 domain-containing protein n=1 Tax=Methylophilus sp. TaxID=29541 RepID=UPI0011D5C880|nr:DUF4186 domain-containing protein [Methylophilus sp.]TXI44305.1 MAG: DUF4186 domain-containing protein [Methylophilus sp.]